MDDEESLRGFIRATTSSYYHPVGTCAIGETAESVVDSELRVHGIDGLRVVVDCAHGAAYELAPRMLRRAGADVTAIGVAPDGDNINSGCGSTSLDALKAAVVSSGVTRLAFRLVAAWWY